jgi:uncharacterized protein with von Willebrand factor type A (vWA) domain
MDSNEIVEDTIPAEESTHDLSSTTGIEDLRAAFGVDYAEESDTSSTEDSTPASTEAGAPVTDEEDDGVPNAPAAFSDEDLSKVFRDPRVVNQLRDAQARSLSQARQMWERELQAQREADEELLLDDEEIGRRERAKKAVEPILNGARAEGYARAQQEFVLHGIGDIWNQVPELKGLDAQTKAQYDPTSPTWKTFGEYINAIVDLAANKRSEKLAGTKAKAIAEAKTRDEMNKFRKTQPNPAGAPGNGSAVGKIFDVDKMSGKELMRRAFGE